MPASRFSEAGEQIQPYGLAIDPGTDAVYMSECYSPCRILKYGSTGLTERYAGTVQGSLTGDGGLATSATISNPSMAVDGNGAMFISNFFELRRIDPITHIISRFAGTGGSSCNYSHMLAVGDVAATVAMLPTNVLVDPITGNLWVTDYCSGTVNAISANGVVVWQSPVVANVASSPQSAFDSAGNYYWSYSRRVYRMSRSGVVTVFAGTGGSGDTGDGGLAVNASFGSNIWGLAIDRHDNVYIGTESPNRLRRVDGQGIITTLNDTSAFGGYAGDGGALSSARFNSLLSMAFDSAGNLYIADNGNNRIRMVRPSSGGSVDRTSIITTFAGGAGASNAGEVRGGGNPSELCDDNCDDDVSTASGEYTETQADLTIPGRGVALALSRTYGTSSAQIAGRLGYGWTDSYNMSLRVDPDSNNVIISQENGAQLTFYPNGSGAFSGPSRQLATLVANSDGTYTLTRAARLRFIFDAAGRLIAERDLNGYVTSLSYDGTGRLASVSDPAGRTLSFTYDGSGRISLASDSAGRQVQYGYDAAGNLATVTDVRGKQWAYTYDGNHLLLTRSDPNGHTDVANAYDARGRLASQEDALHHQWTWSYGAGITTTTSPNGSVTKDYYSNGALWKQTKGYGTSAESSTTFGYSAATLGVTLTTDGNGHTWGATYDSAANQLTATDPLAHQTINTYDALNDLTSVTDAKSVKTTYTYDSAGNRLTESTPLVGSSPAQNRTTSFTYGDSSHPGDVTAVTDPRGKATTNAYDAHGNLTSVTDAAGNTTTYGYDGIGRRTSMVSPRGNAAGADPADFTTTYVYDAAGNKLSETDPLGHTTSSGYDDANNLVSTTDANNHTTTYVYDAGDQQTEIHRPDGSVLKSSFDAEGNLASQTDGANNSVSYSYDALNRQVSKLDALNRMTSYGYDAVGNQTSVTDALNRTTTNGYDAANRLTSIAYSDGVTAGVSLGYDADDQRTSMTDGSGSSSWTWDSLHRVTAYTNGHGDSLSFGYDLAGNKTRITYPGSHDVSYAYDNAGRMSSLTDWLSRTTSFGYDRDSNQTSTAFPAATDNVDAYGFDRAGRQTSTTFAKGSTTLASLDYTRDAKGLLTHVDSTGLPGASSHQYSYTSLDQLASDNSDAYAYDAADNPTTLAGVDGAGYDVANQLTSTASGTFGYDALGERTSSTPTGSSATTYGYDQAGHLTSFNPPTGPSATYAYDGTGLRVRKTVGSTTTRFLWDTTAPLPLMLHDGTRSYVYGTDGTVVEDIDASGTPTYYHHDQLGSTRVVTGAAGAVIASASYLPFGAVEASAGPTLPFGFAGEFTDMESGFVYLRARLYDPSTAQFVSVDPAASATRSPYGYVLGNPLNETDPTGLFSFRAVAEWAGRQMARAARWAYNHRSEIAVAVGSAVALILDRHAKGPGLGVMPEGPSLAGSTLSRHAAKRLVRRDITLTEVDQALRNGKRYWDFSHNTISYVHELESGKTMVVARNPKTGVVSTVIKRDRQFNAAVKMDNGRARYMPMDPLEG